MNSIFTMGCIVPRNLLGPIQIYPPRRWLSLLRSHKIAPWSYQFKVTVYNWSMSPNRTLRLTQFHTFPEIGRYSSWGSWSRCSETCGDGQMTRRRTCSVDVVNGCSRPCAGSAEEVGRCNERECPTCRKSRRWKVSFDIYYTVSNTKMTT